MNDILLSNICFCASKSYNYDAIFFSSSSSTMAPKKEGGCRCVGSSTTTLFSRVLLWARAQARTLRLQLENQKHEKGCLREREREREERERERTGKCSDCVRWLQQNDLLGLTIKVSRRERERERERERSYVVYCDLPRLQGIASLAQIKCSENSQMLSLWQTPFSIFLSLTLSLFLFPA